MLPLRLVRWGWTVRPSAAAVLQRPSARPKVTISGGGAFAPAFRSTWDTADLGTDIDDIKDGGIWPQSSGGSATLVLEVATSTDIVASPPRTKCLKVKWEQIGRAGNVEKSIDVPDLTTPLYHAFLALVAPGSAWNAQAMNHPQNLDVTTIQCVFWKIGGPTTSTTWKTGIVYDNPSEGIQKTFNSPTLSYATVYAFKYRRDLIQTSPTIQQRVFPFIYSYPDMTLLYDADDYILQGGSTTLQEWYDAGNYNTIEDGGGRLAAEIARRFIFGNEDPDGATGDPRHYAFWDIVADDADIPSQWWTL